MSIVQSTCNSRRRHMQRRTVRRAALFLCVREYCFTTIAVMWTVSIAIGLSAPPWAGVLLPCLHGTEPAHQTRYHLLLGALVAIPQQRVASMSVLTHCALRLHQLHRQQCDQLLHHPHHGQRTPQHHRRPYRLLLHLQQVRTCPRCA